MRQQVLHPFLRERPVGDDVDIGERLERQCAIRSQIKEFTAHAENGGTG